MSDALVNADEAGLEDPSKIMWEGDVVLQRTGCADFEENSPKDAIELRLSTPLSVAFESSVTADASKPESLWTETSEADGTSLPCFGEGEGSGDSNAVGRSTLSPPVS